MSICDIILKIKKIARGVAIKIFNKNSRERKESKSTDFQNVDINSVKTMRPRSFGRKYLYNSIWKKLRINNFLIQSRISPNTIPLLEALALNRLIIPGSKRHTKEWTDNQSSTLYEITCSPLHSSLNSYYEGEEALFKVKDERG